MHVGGSPQLVQTLATLLGEDVALVRLGALDFARRKHCKTLRRGSLGLHFWHGSLPFLWSPRTDYVSRLGESWGRTPIGPIGSNGTPVSITSHALVQRIIRGSVAGSLASGRAWNHKRQFGLLQQTRVLGLQFGPRFLGDDQRLVTLGDGINLDRLGTDIGFQLARILKEPAACHLLFIGRLRYMLGTIKQLAIGAADFGLQKRRLIMKFHDTLKCWKRVKCQSR